MTWLLVVFGVKGVIFHVDEMSKIPLIHDATSYLLLNEYRGSVLAGDGPDCFDHTFLPQYTCKGSPTAGENDDETSRKRFALKMTVSGVVVCMHDDDVDTGNLKCKDLLGRESFKRGPPQGMCNSLRCVYRPKQYGMNECEQHWNDITIAYEGLAEPRPTVFVVCSDNGNSYSPHKMMNLYYADLFMKKYPLIVLTILCSFAPGQSAKNHEIERMWSQFKKVLAGLRLGASVLDFELRAPKDEKECVAVVHTAAVEMIQLFETNVNVCETKGSICAPEVGYVEPPTGEELKMNAFVHEFFMSNKRSTAEDPKFAEMRKQCIDINDRSTSTVCQTLLWKVKDPELAQKYFGLSEKPFEPEVCPEMSGKGKLHYKTFVEMLQKYYNTGTMQEDDPKRCPRDEKKGDPRICCFKFWLSEAERSRHRFQCHPHAAKPGRHTFSERKRPSKKVRKKVVVGRSGREVEFNLKNNTPLNFEFEKEEEDEKVLFI